MVRGICVAVGCTGLAAFPAARADATNDLNALVDAAVQRP